MIDSRKVSLSPSSETHQLWCDPAPVVSVSGFEPVTEVRLVSTCEDGAGKVWQSQNGYLVTAKSSFATDSNPAMGDDYYGIAHEGLIASMRCQDGPGHSFTLPQNGTLEIDLRIFDQGEEFWSARVLRHSHGSGELSGTESAPCVALLHNGSPAASHGASMLRALGFRVLDHEIRPESPELDPLLQKLRRELDEDRALHLVASGRASEAALELAQRLPQLASVVVFSGSGLRFSPWKIEGNVLAHTQCDHSTLQPRGASVLSPRTVFAEAVVDRENRDRGRISVENIPAPLFLFTGSDDQIWPSAAFSELVAQRRKAHNLEQQTYHKTFANVGYDLGPELGLPGFPTTERSVSHPSTGLRLALGGKMGRQSRARRECWESLVSILLGKKLQEFQLSNANATPTDP